MKQLSKYQRKNMTPDEIAEYEAAMKTDEYQTTYVYGGKITVEQDEDCWLVTAYDNDDSSLNFVYCDEEDIDEYIEKLSDELAELDEDEI